jgi:hypothetical protein
MLARNNDTADWIIGSSISRRVSLLGAGNEQENKRPVARLARSYIMQTIVVCDWLTATALTMGMSWAASAWPPTDAAAAAVASEADKSSSFT